MPDDVVFTSPWDRCLRLSRAHARHPARYAIVASEDGHVLAEIRWQGSTRRYVLLPCAETIWCSIWLSEAGVWLRRLTRLQLRQAS